MIHTRGPISAKGFACLATAAMMLIASAADAKSVESKASVGSGSSALKAVATIAASAATGATDRNLLRDARLAFEKKDYRRAINLYSKIPATSDYWSESLEERAWALVHVKEHDQALSLVKTLTAPPVKHEIGGEPYLLSGIVQLRLCNYNELFRVMKRFKGDIQPRYEALQVLAKTGNSPAAEKFLSRSFDAGDVSRATAGEDLANLPRMVYRDKKLRSAFQASMKPGSDKHMANVRARLKSLAERDVKDLGEVLRKFHLMEVEAVSRMYSKVHLADAKTPSSKVQRDANTLVFPDDAEDVWLDELDNYHVEASGCPGAPSANSAGAVSSKGPKS